MSSENCPSNNQADWIHTPRKCSVYSQDRHILTSTIKTIYVYLYIYIYIYIQHMTYCMEEVKIVLFFSIAKITLLHCCNYKLLKMYWVVWNCLTNTLIKNRWYTMVSLCIGGTMYVVQIERGDGTLSNTVWKCNTKILSFFHYLYKQSDINEK